MSFNFNKRRIWFCTKNGNQSTINISSPTNTIYPHIMDSKIPITHQRLTTTRSPAPPMSARITSEIPKLALSHIHTPKAPIPNPKTFVQPNIVGKTRLFYNYYEDKNPIRKNEIDFCLRKNIENSAFDLIIIESENNPTFNFMFERINRLSGPNDINIICNSDIFFDQTISFANRIGFKEVYALNRWDLIKFYDNNTAKLLDNDRNQDVWIIRGKIEGVDGNFQMGKPGCDGRIAYELKKAGYNVMNPSRSIKAYHYHDSGVRHYTEADRVSGEHFYVKPTTLQ
jgi:hypothetical protein